MQKSMDARHAFALDRYRYWLSVHNCARLAARLANREAGLELTVAEYRRLDREKRNEDLV